MKLVNKLKERRADNKGFSLVELIIVIAIMAILVGIVGTQVVPYLNRSKEAKDLQLVNSYSTAAMTAYSSNAGTVSSATDITIDNVYDSSLSGDSKLLADKIKELVGYATIDDLKAKMGSTTGKNVSGIKVEYKFSTKTIITTAVGTTLDAVNADL